MANPNSTTKQCTRCKTVYSATTEYFSPSQLGAHGADVELQKRSQNGLCWWCGDPHGDNYEVDHRIPLSRGGTNWPENICIACFDCNRSKHNKLPHEWIGRLL